MKNRETQWRAEIVAQLKAAKEKPIGLRYQAKKQSKHNAISKIGRKYVDGALAGWAKCEEIFGRQS